MNLGNLRSQFFDLAAVEKEDQQMKIVKKIFSEEDLKPDSERNGTHIFHSEYLDEKFDYLKELRGEKTFESLLKLLKEKVLFSFCYGDEFSTNDAFLYPIKKGQRRRYWINRENGKLFRIELSKSILDDISSTSFNVDNVIPKL